MILQILGTLFVVLLVYLIQVFYLEPKRIMKRYVEFLKAKGYRVCHIPYSLLHNQYYFLTNKNSKGESNGDPFKNLRQVYPNYDVIITNMLNRPLIQLCSPELIKDFYAVDKHYSFPKQRKSIGTYTRILGNGLVFSEDKQWKRKRTILNRVFNFDFLKSQTNNIAEISERCVEHVEKKLMVVDEKSKKKIIQIDVLEILMQIFSEVMLKIFLGMSSDQKIQGQPVANFIKILMDDATIAGYQLLSLLFGEKFMDLGLRKMDRSIKRRVKLYRNWAIPFVKKKIDQIQGDLKKNPNKTHPNDIIQALIMEKNKQNKQNSETYGSITDSEQLVDEFTTFFFAGTQTTSNYLQIMINSIVKHPAIEKKVRQQIAKYMSSDDYSYENLKNFTYIDNIQKETTRMYGPAIFIFWRMAKEDNYLGDLPVKKNTMLSLVNIGNQLSDKYFKNPLQFRPQRWDDECKDLPPFVLGGFSFGGRSCIGKHLAMIESKIVLIKFMKRYEQILLPNNDFKLEAKFIFCSQTLKTKLIKTE